jgi:hypothetical protein
MLKSALECYSFPTQVTVELPDELASHMIPSGQDPARAILEDALVQGYRESKISGTQLMDALGIATRYELDGFLKERQVWIEYTAEQMEADRLFQDQFVATHSIKQS